MTGSAETAASPFRLLGEVESARELLVLSYTANLDFFERFALSEARALGAIVTLISDATMVSADPVVTRRAGTAYLDARAICPGAAFHPKLVVLVGDDEVRVAVGSGNLTLAGWHANAEIWTVLRGDANGAPTTLAEVCAYLRRLAESQVRLSPGGAPALERVADRLGAIPATEEGPRLLDNLEQSIIEQLPSDHCEELICCAPFFDRGLRALGELTERFSPSSIGVHLQSQTMVDGPALLKFLDGRGGEVSWIEDDRYHHGKLVEWTVAGGRFALSGSPNLSAPALARSVADGGNCELALLTRVDGSLAPAGGAPPAGAAASLTMGPPEEPAAAGLLLLGAIQEPGSVALVLDRAPALDGRVQRYDTTADGWRQVATFEAGHLRYDLDPSIASPGQPLRLVLDDESTSNTVFVTDLGRVVRRQMSAIGKVRKSPPDVAIEGLGSALLADIEELRPHLLSVGALVPIAPSGDNDADTDDDADDSEHPRARPNPGQTLDDYLAACEAVLGREMTEFALVLPVLPGIGTNFDERLGELVTDFEDDEIASGDPNLEGDDPHGLGPTLHGLGPQERSRWRRWVERLVDRGARYPMVVRTLALRSVLHGVLEQIWDEDDSLAILARATKALGTVEDESTDDERAAAASLAAIALALLRADVDRLSVLDEETMRYEDTSRSVAPLLGCLDRDRLEIFAADVPKALREGLIASSERVAAEALGPATGVRRAISLLVDEHGIEAQEGPDGAIEFGDPLPTYAEQRVFLALGLTREAGPVVARGEIDEHTTVFAAWKKPLLVVERRNAQRRWGRLFELPPSLSPLTYAGPDQSLPRVAASWGGEECPPETAQALLCIGL